MRSFGKHAANLETSCRKSVSELEHRFSVLAGLRKGESRHDYFFLQTPQVPPCFPQCLQYLQFLQTEQELLPEQPRAAFAPVQQAGSVAVAAAEIKTAEAKSTNATIALIGFIDGPLLEKSIFPCTSLTLRN
jgi:hypothetical protein